jgi:hypothetical protein
MKYYLYALFFISTFGEAQDVSKVRAAYGSLEKDPVATQALYDVLKDVSEEKTLLAGYKGAIVMLQAKHVKGIKNKKKLFKDGLVLLEGAIEVYPNNIEMRTLRMSIQENAPKFLKYNKQIEEDKKFILENLKNTTSSSVKVFVNSYVSQSKLFSDSERTHYN